MEMFRGAMTTSVQMVPIDLVGLVDLRSRSTIIGAKGFAENWEYMRI